MKTSSLTLSLADRRVLILTAALLATVAWLVLAPRPARADILVSADLGPVRVLYADPGSVVGAPLLCRPAPVYVRPVPRFVRPIHRVTVAPRTICGLTYAHAHDYTWVPAHWERGRGHHKHWVAGRYVCLGDAHGRAGHDRGHGRGTMRGDRW